MTTSHPPAPAPRWGFELALIAAVSLGPSAVYAIVRLADVLSRGPIADAQAKLNTSASPRPWFDLIYQLLDIGFTLVPVLLALWLMSRDSLYVAAGSTRGIDVRPPLQRIGLTLQRPWGDLWRGTLVFLVIGAGTLVIYFAGRLLGLTADIQPANLGSYWWTVPVLLLAAVKNGVLEEVLLLGYGVDRLEKTGLRPWLIVLSLALFRGSYHLYQGIGPFVGNVIMGVTFGVLYLRGRRVMPFVVAHTIIDAVGFLAPGILAAVDPR